ncbi:MAG: hypothetical protein HRU31_01970 [Rhodobacteraceae bacterium]|nr:hypothetical protein [Paracoccaceae bacterium]
MAATPAAAHHEVVAVAATVPVAAGLAVIGLTALAALRRGWTPWDWWRK